MFRTELQIAPATGQLPRTARILTMGSCFADSIGARLALSKVETLANPFGTVFQPLALGRLLRAAAGEDVDWQQHLVEARGRWQSYDLHGSIGAETPVELLQLIQALVLSTGEFLRQADVVLLTLGTAWAYRLRETGELVSNCHKQPAELFERELLTPDDIINGLAETHAYLRRINPGLRFVLTVSPVRHLKDTLPLNAVSKSVLRLATHFVSELLPGVAYFPAFELLTDDLRDYRFYADDMLHPSAVAEDYIWDKFARTYFDADFGRFRKEWAAVRQALEHRPLYEGAPEQRQFLESTQARLEQLSLRKVGVDAELNTVRTRLAALPIPSRPEPAAVPEDDEARIDIGEDLPAPVDALPGISAAPTATQPATAGSRPPRLSPEEFRAQRAARPNRPERGRRDGRGRGQEVPTENEQFQTADSTDAQAAALQPVSEARAETTAAIEPVLTEQIEAGSQDKEDTASAAGEDVGQEPGKKKKRRSRGGAKRTARKHALRLAEGEEPSVADAAIHSIVSPENRGARPDERKASVITKSVPVKRGGRRDEAGRVPRVPLFAAPSEQPMAGDVELPPLKLAPALVALPEGLRETAAAAEAPVAESKSRNSRNRKKKGVARGETDSALSAAGSEETPPPIASAVDLPIGTAEELSGAPVSAAAPTQPLDAAGAGQTVPAVQANAARSPRRSKARAIGGGRAEKPAVDTPVVPVPDATQLRTQVAAGRLLGDSATLVEPVVAGRKAAQSKKAGPVSAAKPKTASQAAAAKNPVSPKVKSAKAVPALIAPVLEVVPPAANKPAARTQSAAKNKPVAKAGAKATPPKPAASKPAMSEPAAPPAAKPKGAAAKAATPPTAVLKKAAVPKAAKPKASAKPTAAPAKPLKKPAKPA